MTTALATLSSVKDLTELELAIMAEAAEDANAYDPIPTKITISPGGTNIFVTSDNEPLKTFTAIVVLSQKARAYWPEKGTGQPPMCSSHDGATGYLNGSPNDMQMAAAETAHMPHPVVTALRMGTGFAGSFACATCPLSQFGSAHQGGQGKSQACKAMRRLVVLVDGWAQPALLTLPPTSLKAFDAYASGLARNKSAYFAVRTKFSLEAQKSGAGDPYSVAALSVAGKLSADELRAVIQVREQFGSLVRELPIEGAEYDTTSSVAVTSDNGLDPF